ncbi:MAG TPA: carboxypeptidase-like regulatory domain-containing protein [Gemmatimonadaceae bacterium]
MRPPGPDTRRLPTGAPGPLVLILAATALLATAASASAQLVRGVVVDSASDEPLAGATVRLVSDRGGAVGGALLGADGRFVLRAPSPGRYAVQVQRVGWSLTRDTTLDLAASDTIWRRIVVAAVPVSLSEIRVTGRGGCGARSDARETFLVWEEARKALDATMVTRGSRLIRAAVVDYDRELDLRSLRVEKESREERVGLVTQPYFSPPPETFHALGYMQELDGDTWFFAPSAEVLLSPYFLREHCLHLVPGSGARAGMVGLRFEPAATRKLPDISGVLWLDVRSAELRDIEFRYTGLPDYMPSSKIGGRVEFARLSNGAWVMRRWVVRAPILQRQNQPQLHGNNPGGLGSAHGRSGETRYKVLAIREVEGEIVWATSATGVALFGAPPP